MLRDIACGVTHMGRWNNVAATPHSGVSLRRETVLPRKIQRMTAFRFHFKFHWDCLRVVDSNITAFVYSNTITRVHV